MQPKRKHLLTGCLLIVKKMINVPFLGTRKQRLHLCKSSLADVATLTYTTPDQQLCLLVDVSNTAVGAALNCLTENGPQSIAFFSSKLSATETKYSTYDIELLAIYLYI
ncbi:hypothetical protein TNIN_337541 [Trichonephila inaurata madagascariensis]|uniref:Reverse transcriptase/retrotransposon-derived protein RNase H-like domain-containing protein n=1 Tax=Trichonephila inaurata madagascariensis TaxID=2747483 RepID=A0A8X7BQY6_9ARAC|nr:hypothetical protein TNIN_337541 [Trichonephila inaurata madagascariensis]